MTALYIAIGVVAGLLLLIVMAFLFGRAKVRIVCRDKLTVRASILGIRFTLYPDKKEKPEEKKSLKKCRNPHRALQRELARQEKAARKKLKALEKAKESVISALNSVELCVPLDLVAEDVKAVWDALGEITGTTASEEIISEIFAKFCVGK